MPVSDAARWGEFADRDAAMAAVGARMFAGGNVGILATIKANGEPRVAPVSPIFFDTGIYLSVGAHTPKLADLEDREAFALHAMLDASDEEFQLSGAARRVTDAVERAGVVGAIPFPTYDPDDPIFELLIRRALWARWSGPGQNPVKRSWP